MKNYRNWKVRIHLFYKAYFLSWPFIEKVKQRTVCYVELKKTWFATFWQKNWNMLIAAASDLPVLKCLIQFLQNRRLVNYCFLFVIACRFFQLFKNFFTKKPFNQISKLNKLFKKILTLSLIFQRTTSNFFTFEFFVTFPWPPFLQIFSRRWRTYRDHWSRSWWRQA